MPRATPYDAEAVDAALQRLGRGERLEGPGLRAAVRALARRFAEEHPGRAVEVRVPPYVAVQCLQGVRHTRGTPPATVEVEPVAWVLLCAGRLSWGDAVADGRVRASGERSDLSPLLPVLSADPVAGAG